MCKLPMSIRPLGWALVSSLLLAACASTPIEETPAADASVATGSTAPGASAQTSVAPVTAARAPQDAVGPSDAARVVYFEYDSYTIRPEFQPVLDAHARFLGTHPARKLTIAGHTDERGGREYNLALGQQRADAVRRALQLLGVRPTQIESISFGEEKPVAAGHEEAAWSGNRRAELAYR
jgi:peptidoglycan-associated lipoprotein